MDTDHETNRAKRDSLCPKCRQKIGTGFFSFFKSAAVFDLFLTICSCGLWIPMWIWGSHARRKRGICLECGEAVQPEPLHTHPVEENPPHRSTVLP